MFDFNRYKSKLQSHLPAFVAGMAGALIIQLGFYLQPRAIVSTVNITGLVGSFIKETAKQNLLLEEKEKKVTQFSSIMKKVLDDTASRQNTVIMPSEAVVAGSVDLTDEVAKKIKKELQ